MEIKTDYSDIKFKNNGKLKLLIIVGTRPEIIRLAAVINKCREYFDCILRWQETRNGLTGLKRADITTLTACFSKT